MFANEDEKKKKKNICEDLGKKKRKKNEITS